MLMAGFLSYISVVEETKLVVLEFNLDVLCYACKDLPLIHALSRLVIPGLIDQMTAISKILLPDLLTSHHQVRHDISHRYLFSRHP